VAQSYCNGNILDPLVGNWDVYYVPTENPDPYPPPLEKYLHSTAVTSKIGSQSRWVKVNSDVYDQFASTGDWMRSSLSDLEAVINASVRTVLFDGDADYICNYMGVEAMVRASCFLLLLLAFALTLSLHAKIDSLHTEFSPEFAKQNFSSFTVKGKPAGQYKNAGRFSYLRVSGAGHQVPAYLWRGVPRGAAALQMFTQIMSDKPLSGT
jgi:carboxypeptidase C (cathepsin A)